MDQLKMNNFLKLIILCATLSSSSAMAEKISHLISVGDDITCAFGEGRGKCWSSNWEKSLFIGNVKKIASATSGEAFCAIIDEKIKCLSAFHIETETGPQVIDGINNPTEILGSTRGRESSFCANDKEAIKCWVIDEGEATIERRFSNKDFHKSHLYTYANFASCIGLGFWCPSEPLMRALKAFELSSPVSSWWFNSWSTTCGIHSNGNVVCFDNYSNESTLSDGEGVIFKSKSCFLYKSQVKCNDYDKILEKIAPKIVTSKLKNPKGITNTKDSICILDDEEVKCWNEQGSEKFDLGPSMKAPNFGLNELPNFLNEISKGSSLIKSKFYGNLSEYVSVELSEKTENLMEQFTQKAAQYTIASLLASSIEDGDSKYYINHVSPSYKDSMTKIEIETGLTGLSSVPDLSATRKAALKVIHAALSVIDNFLTNGEKERIQPTLRLLGQALAAPSNSDAIHSLLNDLSEMEDVFTKLSKSRKAAFLITTLNEAVEFLNGKTGY